MSKPKVLVSVLTSSESWVNPWLVANLLQMHQDSRFSVEVQLIVDARPVDFARNCCIITARERGADWLLMIDCDQSFWIQSPLDVLARAGWDKHVIAFPYAQHEPGKGSFWGPEEREPESEFFRVKRAGTGAMLINRHVWEKIPGPWFKWCYAEDEARNVLFDLAGTALHEDYYFSKLVQEHGVDVWCHKDAIPHWKRRDITGLLPEHKPPIIPASTRTTDPKDVRWSWVTSKFCRVIKLSKRALHR